MTFIGVLKYICFVSLLCHGTSMFSKRSLGYDPSQLSPSKRLKRNLEDLFLINDISGLRAQQLFQDAKDAGVSGVRKLAKAGNEGRATSHVHRDLLREMTKQSKWPDLYWATIRTWSAKAQAVQKVQVPLLLPHELVNSIAARSNLLELLQTDGLSENAKKHLLEVSAKTGFADFLALGLWLDGTPCNWDRTKSVETIALSFPGQTGDLANMRVPLCATLKEDCVTHETMDDLLEIVAWSLQCLLTGHMPSARHDGSSFHAEKDRRRLRQAGKPIGCRGVLCELRADWACLKQTFRFPGWREQGGCCFRCNATPQEAQECNSAAPWKRPERRHTQWTLLEKMLREGRGVSPIFSAPFVTIFIFVIDWLHCCDLGVGQDFLGNLFFFILSKMEGSNQETRARSLFKRMQTYYSQANVSSKLDNLTLTMIRKTPTAPPKLRSKAAETRCLIPFAVELGEEFLSADVPFEATAKQCCIELNKCYSFLSRSNFNGALLQEASMKFCLLYKALGQFQADESKWRLKPKFHLWLECCAEQSCPSAAWTYRDEDFGGSVAKLAHRRGGGHTAGMTSKAVLTKFRARHDLPIAI